MIVALCLHSFPSFQLHWTLYIVRIPHFLFIKGFVTLVSKLWKCINLEHNCLLAPTNKLLRMLWGCKTTRQNINLVPSRFYDGKVDVMATLLHRAPSSL